MSRSYKSIPVFKENTKDMKKIANHRFRRFLKLYELFPKGNLFKKVFNQYDICDWKTYPSSKEQQDKAIRK